MKQYGISNFIIRQYFAIILNICVYIAFVNFMCSVYKLWKVSLEIDRQVLLLSMCSYVSFNRFLLQISYF